MGAKFRSGLERDLNKSPGGKWEMFDGELQTSAVMDLRNLHSRLRGIKKAFDPDQPRDEKGMWTAVGYHGTASEFEDFEARTPHNKLTGKDDVKGIYFSGDHRAASGYASMRARESGSKINRVIAANLYMQNPLDITNAIKRGRKKGLSFGDAKREAMKALTAEHDGVVFRGNSVNPPEYIVFHASQIHRIVKP